MTKVSKSVVDRELAKRQKEGILNKDDVVVDYTQERDLVSVYTKTASFSFMIDDPNIVKEEEKATADAKADLEAQKEPQPAPVPSETDQARLRRDREMDARRLAGAEDVKDRERAKLAAQQPKAATDPVAKPTVRTAPPAREEFKPRVDANKNPNVVAPKSPNNISGRSAPPKTPGKK